MLELTKTPRTDGMVTISAVVPADRVPEVEQAIHEAVEPLVSIEEAFEDTSPGRVLRGARGLREMTQAKLAEKLGISKQHISGMERGVKTIGKAMAKRLGQALDMPYKMFL